MVQHNLFNATAPLNVNSSHDIKRKGSLSKVDRLNIAGIGSNIVNVGEPQSNSKVSKIPISAVKFGGV